MTNDETLNPVNLILDAPLALIFHAGLISTGLQRGGQRGEALGAASAALTACEKPLKRLQPPPLDFTGLKPGANEKGGEKCEMSGLARRRPQILASDFGFLSDLVIRHSSFGFNRP